MKAIWILSLILLQTAFASGQNQYWKRPYKYNSFINKAGISWACEMNSVHSFDQQADHFNIHAYLVKAQKDGSIRTYLTNEMMPYEGEKWVKARVDDYYSEMTSDYGNRVLEGLQDSLNSLEFNEIFYVEDHKLRSKIISAGPQFKVITSTGVYLGNTVTAHSSLSYYPDPKQKKKDIVIFLGQTCTLLNFDSIESSAGLKKTYGMTLSLLLWNDLSNGFNSATDLKSGSSIPGKLIMTYSAFDSLEVPCGDTNAMCKVPAPPAFQYLSDIGIYQNWYYNKTRDFFFNDIPKADLYIKFQDPTGSIYRSEKRFEINFK